MRSRRTYDSNTSFLDLLMNTLVAFVGLFAIAMAMMNASKSEKNTESKAEFIITVSWPKELDCDIDTYVEDPEGNLVMYRRREDGLMHLDRDDTGNQSDYIETQFGRVEYPDNREIVSIRSSLSGEYVVNVHAFSLTRIKEKPCEVTVQIDKINPFSTVVIKKVVLKNSGDEVTVCRFELNKKGEVVDVNELPKKYTDNPDNYNGE